MLPQKCVNCNLFQNAQINIIMCAVNNCWFALLHPTYLRCNLVKFYSTQVPGVKFPKEIGRFHWALPNIRSMYVTQRVLQPFHLLSNYADLRHQHFGRNASSIAFLLSVLLRVVSDAISNSQSNIGCKKSNIACLSARRQTCDSLMVLKNWVTLGIHISYNIFKNYNFLFMLCFNRGRRRKAPF